MGYVYIYIYGFLASGVKVKQVHVLTVVFGSASWPRPLVARGAVESGLSLCRERPVATFALGFSGWNTWLGVPGFLLAWGWLPAGTSRRATSNCYKRPTSTTSRTPAARRFCCHTSPRGSPRGLLITRHGRETLGGLLKGRRTKPLRRRRNQKRKKPPTATSKRRRSPQLERKGRSARETKEEKPAGPGTWKRSWQRTAAPL